MADFKTHITTSTVLGIAYGTGAHLGFEVPIVPSMLAAGLCSLSGMLPDLDSDSGIPVRETFAFTSALIPMLMIDRFQHMGLGPEEIVLAGGLIYIIFRFGVSEIFKRYTVHRGMWHSIPAACIATIAAFLICSCEDMWMRVFKSLAVFIGFTSHLVLDELYSVDLKRGVPRLKKSAGTALKFWSRSMWANFSTYGKLTILVYLAVNDPVLMQEFGHHETEVPHTATEFWQDVQTQTESLWR